MKFFIFIDNILFLYSLAFPLRTLNLHFLEDGGLACLVCIMVAIEICDSDVVGGLILKVLQMILRCFLQKFDYECSLKFS